MIDEFVSTDIASQLKELGFNEECCAYYNFDFSLKRPVFNQVKPFYHEWCVPAPLRQQALKWFRDTHGFYVHMAPEFYTTGINFNWQIRWYLPKERWIRHMVHNGTFMYGDNGEYPTQEEAETAAIEKMIEIVKIGKDKYEEM